MAGKSNLDKRKFETHDNKACHDKCPFLNESYCELYCIKLNQARADYCAYNKYERSNQCQADTNPNPAAAQTKLLQEINNKLSYITKMMEKRY